jgi:hypothetical protein
MKTPPRSLAKLILMLSSPHDPEVVAAARAIARVLKANGEDWHDLVAKLDRPPRQTRAKAVRATERTMKPAPPPLPEEVLKIRNAARQIMDVRGEATLSGREQQFLSSMTTLRYPPTERQIKWLKDLWASTFPPRVPA